MATVEIYTTPICPYCLRAKRLLGRKGVEFLEIDLWQHPGRREEMIQRASGRRTVPQIFIDGRGVGGSDELHALEAAGKLDALLVQGRGGTVPAAQSGGTDRGNP
jgi:glutaredoxin 3